ncbi:hypothetical protein FOA52_008431 [Chlamydomonas sp. UWO 241]|nr:hypothetical protein FOA52_008431 [Chlamydomonas sp. UWO 241]
MSRLKLEKWVFAEERNLTEWAKKSPALSRAEEGADAVGVFGPTGPDEVVAILFERLATGAGVPHFLEAAYFDAEVAYLKSVGFDDAFNYNTTRPSNALKAMCPNGIDVYFDNVGGETLEAAIDNMNTFGRIVGCGQISQYNVPPEEHYGVHNLFNIVTKRLLFQGFIVGDKAIAAEHGESFKSDMLRYVSEGLVGVEVQEVEGLASAGAAFCEMMAGKNTGKMVVRV